MLSPGSLSILLGSLHEGQPIGSYCSVPHSGMCAGPDMHLLSSAAAPLVHNNTWDAIRWTFACFPASPGCAAGAAAGCEAAGAAAGENWAGPHFRAPEVRSASAGSEDSCTA